MTTAAPAEAPGKSPHQAPIAPPTSQAGSLAPTTRCDWIDQLRGWAVLVMIEVHGVNGWLVPADVPPRLNFVNGLVAPSFLLCAGFSLVLSTFDGKGGVRPLGHTLRRLGFILLCAYLLHAPGLTLVDWTFLGTHRKYRGLFQIDVLQCVVYSLLILHGLARLLRTPTRLGIAALSIVAGTLAVSSTAWASGIAASLPLPIRGMVTGLPIYDVASLFPILPWLTFPALGTALGCLYWHGRVRVRPAAGDGSGAGLATMSETTWLLCLMAAALPAILWGRAAADGWLVARGYRVDLLGALHNTTLPSFCERAGWVCMLGALLGWISARGIRSTTLATVSSESLLVYLFHLTLIYGVLQAGPLVRATGAVPQTQGWGMTALLTAIVMAVSVGVGVLWARVRKDPPLASRWRRRGATVFLLYFALSGWGAVYKYARHPELAEKPYYMLPWARAHKGLPATADGLPTPDEHARAKAQRSK